MVNLRVVDVPTSKWHKSNFLRLLYFCQRKFEEACAVTPGTLTVCHRALHSYSHSPCASSFYTHPIVFALSAVCYLAFNWCANSGARAQENTNNRLRIDTSPVRGDGRDWIVIALNSYWCALWKPKTSLKKHCDNHDDKYKVFDSILIKRHFAIATDDFFSLNKTKNCNFHLFYLNISLSIFFFYF